MTLFEKGGITFKRQPEIKEGLYAIQELPQEPYYDAAVIFTVEELMNQMAYTRIVIEEMIRTFPDVKAEGIIDSEILAILETQLLQADLLTHHDMVEEKNTEVIRISYRIIGKDVFEKAKNMNFSIPEKSKRQSFHYGNWRIVNDTLYTETPTDLKGRPYLICRLPVCETQTDYFKLLFTFLIDAQLEMDDRDCSYEDIMNHMTSYRVHKDTIFFLKMTIRNMLWLRNSTSWYDNKLHGFDRMDIETKYK